MKEVIDIMYMPSKLLSFAGQNIFKNSFILTLLGSIVILTCFTLTLIEPLLHYKGPETWAGALEVGGPSYQWITKMFIYKIYRQTFLQLIWDMNKFWTLNSEGKLFENQLQKIYKFVGRGFQVFFWCSAIASFLMAIKPALTMLFDHDESNPRQLPVVVYHFIDLGKSPFYEITYAFHVLYLYLILTFVVGFDGVFLALCVSAAGQLILLKQALSILEPTPHENCKKLIKKYVDHHNFILKFLKKIRKLFSLLLLNQFISSVICVCMAIYLTTSQNLSDFVFIARCGLFALAGVIQIFIYCLTGTYIKSQMETICDAAYLGPWWSDFQYFDLRRAIILITQRSQTASSFKAGGMVDLDLKSFVAVLRMSFSFFTLMQSNAKLQEK